MPPLSGLISLENGFVDPTHAPADSPRETMSVGTQPAARPSGDTHQASFGPSREFVHFVSKARVRGQSLTHDRPGPYRPEFYVPLAKLQEYWTPKRIGEALNHSGNLPFNPPVIREGYLRVFSTLIYINRVLWLQEFAETNLHDGAFPSDTIPDHWKTNVPRYFGGFWNDFADAQWMFFPRAFDPTQLLNSRIPTCSIFPLDEVELLVQGQAAEILKIRIHEGYNKLPKDSSKTEPNIFVLKTYIGDRNQSLYNHEKRALMALQHHHSEHTVTFYGSFQQEDRRSLILEYVNGGNLFDFMRHNIPPTTQKDILDFWASLVNVLQGLFRVHQITNHAEHAAEYRIVHEDLKPDNILLEVQEGQSKYVFRSKIADFGCSDVLSVNRDGVDPRAVDHHGHPTYSAPEATHHQKWMTRGDNRISSAADIWSMGCIFSEAAAWLVDGDAGRQAYERERSAEHRYSQTFEGSNYVGCFHNGYKALASVYKKHEWINRNRKPCDSVTPEILRIVTTYMLVAPGSRADAKSLMEMFHQILDDHKRISIASTSDDPVGNTSTNYPTRSTSDNSELAEKLNGLHVLTPDTPSSASLTASSPFESPVSLVNSLPRLPSTDLVLTRSQSKTKRFLSSWLPVSSVGPSTLRSPSPSSTTRTGTPLDDYLSFPDVWKYREAKKNKIPVVPRVDELIRKLKTNLGSRDHIFFIEDSPTMAQHKEVVVRTFTVLSYLAKQIDKDDIELFFSSCPLAVHNRSRTTPLIETLEQHQYEQAQGMMENQLGEFIQKNIFCRLPHHSLGMLSKRRPKKPISIFVFTDGCWGPGLDDAAGVDNPVRKLMEEIQKRGLNRTQVMIQFIRFGDDLDGKRYLKNLDDFGQQTKNDIVDTRSVDGNVYAMFIGSIIPGVDMEEDRDPPSPLSDGVSGSQSLSP